MAELSEKRINLFRHAFEHFDKDRKGRITYEDLNAIMILLEVGITEQEIKDMMNEIDINETKAIDFKTYITLIARKYKDEGIETEHVECFKLINRSGDNNINPQEIRFLLKALGEEITTEEANQMIKMVNETKTSLNFKEFMSYLDSI